MARVLAHAALLVSLVAGASAQDIQGIENCAAEKAMDRRTGCLQSNMNFLQQQLTKAASDNRRKIDAANQRLDAANVEIAALKATVMKLQAVVDSLQAAAKKTVEPKK